MTTPRPPGSWADHLVVRSGLEVGAHPSACAGSCIPALLKQWRTKIREDQENQGRARRKGRHRDERGPDGGRARRIFTAGNRTGCQHDSPGRTRDDARSGERPHPHDSRSLPRSTRATLGQIRDTTITSSSTRKTATEVRRENLQRKIAVTGRFEDMSLGEGMKQVQKTALI